MSRRYYYNNGNYENIGFREAVSSMFGLFIIIVIGQQWNVIFTFFSQYGGTVIGIIISILILLFLSYVLIKYAPKLADIIVEKISKKDIVIEDKHIEAIKETQTDISTVQKREVEPIESIRDINFFLKRFFPVAFKENEIYGISGYLRLLHPKIFEELIQLIFKLQDYEIIQSSKWIYIKGEWVAKKDGGIDLICKKNDISYFIQAKGTVYQSINDDVIRNFHGSTINKRNPLDKAIVITSTFFSDQAKKTASEDNIMLIDYEKFRTLLEKLYKEDQYRKTIQQFFLTHTYHKEDKYLQNNFECPDCGAPLLYRENNGKTPCLGCAKFCGYIIYLNNTYHHNWIKQGYYPQKQYQYH